MTDLDGPLNISVNWIGDARRIWTFMGMSDRSVSGAMELSGKIGGTLNKPNVDLSLYLAKGIYEDRVLGISLSDIDLEAKADQDGNLSVLLSGEDGEKGTVALEGKVIFFAEEPSINMRAQVKHLSPLHRDDLGVTLSGLVSISGPFKTLTINARTVIETAELSLSKSLGGPSVKTLEIAEDAVPKSLGPALDLSVSIPGEAFVRGMGLDSEWKGEVRIMGNTGSPTISGYLRPSRGYFTFMGKDFIFTGGEISFRNQKKLNPGLNIELTRNVPNLTAILRIQGTLDKPRISFVSNPPYPQDEVLSQVLFNKGASDLSRLEALQLANSLRELTGMGPKVPNPLVSMREALGLSVLRFGEASGSGDRHLESNSFRKNLGLDDEDSDDSDAVASTLEAGKYINDKIYVGLEQNLTDNTTGVRVEVELSPKINLSSRTTSNSSRIALGWKHDY
jgi:translocation and assembly module TamB